MKHRLNLKSETEIAAMREGGKILAYILETISGKIKPGIYGDEIEELANIEIRKHNAVPSFKNYTNSENKNPFPSSICFSVNDEIVHGVPFGKLLRDGDIVGIDLGIKYKEFHTDSAVTVGVGKISAEAEKLIKVAKESLYKGIKQIRADNRIGDIGFAIQNYVEKNGFSIVREMVGHGVGRSIHEFPEIPNFGRKKTGLKLCVGMTFAIEPMINAGDWHIKCNSDQWTVRTRDGRLSAHFEHTVAVTKDGCEVLTHLI